MVFSPSTFDLKQHVHIHFIKDDQPVAPVPVSVHLFVLVDGLSQTGQEECREGQGLAGLIDVPAEGFAGAGDIKLDQPVHGMFAEPHPPAVGHEKPGPGIGQNGMRVVFCFHGCCSLSPK